MNNSTTSKALLALLLVTATATACGAGTDDLTAGVPAEVGSDADHDDPSPGGPPTATDDGAGPSKDLTGTALPVPVGDGTGVPTAPPATPGADLDEDGVRKLLPSAATGTSFRLGTNDPNDLAGFLIEQKVVAREQALGSLRYWNTNTFNLNYSGGGTGKTTRLHIIGGEQKFTWKSQAGFLSSATDFRNQEFTAFVRVHDIFDAGRAMVTMKIRGGKHMASNGDLASCTMMTISPSAKTMFGKELTHPSYDYVKLTPQTDASLTDNKWVGLKIVSYAKPAEPTKVVNQLYVDTNPFDAEGTPLNGWKLLSEYVDMEGKSTGRYSKLADWGGEQTTVRIDGVTSVDFALVSAREITPPN
jgi:hypothetical protein